MNPLDSELQRIEELYDMLEARLEKQHQDFRLSLDLDPTEQSERGKLTERLLAAEKRLAQIVQADNADPAPPGPERVQIKTRAELLRKRAHNLLELIERNAAQCRELKRASQDALRQLQIGGQFLQSVRGYRENQPKYLDAHQ